MKLNDIIKELTKIQKTIPTFIDSKYELDNKIFKLYYQTYDIIKMCIRNYFLDEDTISTLQVEYYSLFVNIYNQDLELFQLCSEHNTKLIKNLITLLEDYEFYEAAQNVLNLIKNIE